MSGRRRQSRGAGASPPSEDSTDIAAVRNAPIALSTTETPDATAQTSRTPLSPRHGQVFRVPEPPRSGPSESSRKAAKVAIPRLKKSLDPIGETSTRSGGRHRVTHACEPCRHRKTKCSGERPVCKHCQDFKIACYYADGKRDRVKK
jgi:Fungal Zn(2)-Cys(6) binuclear cluster domain